MQIKVTKDGGWHTGRIGEVFDVRTVTTGTHRGQPHITFEVDLVGRDRDGAFAGLISADECEVVDWTDAPLSMEVQRLQAQVATLTAERDTLAASLATQDEQSSSDHVYMKQLRDELAAVRAERDALAQKANYWATGYANLTAEYNQDREMWIRASAERDTLAAKLAAAQAELHELRIRVGK